MRLAPPLFFALLLSTSVAVANAETAEGFAVVESNVRIPSTERVTRFEAIDSNSVLLRTAGHLYVAHLSAGCALAAPFREQIAIDEAPGLGGVDTFASLLIDGRRCPIAGIDRVERVTARQ